MCSYSLCCCFQINVYILLRCLFSLSSLIDVDGVLLMLLSDLKAQLCVLYGILKNCHCDYYQQGIKTVWQLLKLYSV